MEIIQQFTIGILLTTQKINKESSIQYYKIEKQQRNPNSLYYQCTIKQQRKNNELCTFISDIQGGLSGQSTWIDPQYKEVIHKQ